MLPKRLIQSSPSHSPFSSVCFLTTSPCCLNLTTIRQLLPSASFKISLPTLFYSSLSFWSLSFLSQPWQIHFKFLFLFFFSFSLFAFFKTIHLLPGCPVWIPFLLCPLFSVLDSFGSVLDSLVVEFSFWPQPTCIISWVLRQTSFIYLFISCWRHAVSTALYFFYC